MPWEVEKVRKIEHVPMLASAPRMPALSAQMGARVGCFHVGGTYSRVQVAFSSLREQ